MTTEFRGISITLHDWSVLCQAAIDSGTAHAESAGGLGFDDINSDEQAEDIARAMRDILASQPEADAAELASWVLHAAESSSTDAS